MKNPWMSLWLSSAHTFANTARGLWMAEIHRQQTLMANEMMREMMAFWGRAFTPQLIVARPRRR